MNHQKLKKAYTKMYTQLMKYIWPVSTVDVLADLEISVCNVFPIMSDVRNNFYRLKAAVGVEIREDKDLAKVFEDFEETMKEDVTFANIVMY